MKSHIPNSKDLVLIGGGHSHAIALKKFGMEPLPGVRLTLITDVSHTPYSGMLPGYVAGLYSFDQCHIDLRPLVKFAQATMIVDKAIGLDLENSRVLCANRPPVAFDLLSIDIGSTPAAVTVPGAAAYTISAKPISQFLSYWRQVTHTVRQFPQRKIRLAIVGGGAGGVELALSVQAHLQEIYRQTGQPRQNLEMHLFHRGAKLLPERNPWVGKRLEQILKRRGVKLHLREEVCAIEIEVDANQTYSQTGLTQTYQESPPNPPTLGGVNPLSSRFGGRMHKSSQRDLPKLIHTQSGLTVECDYIFWVTQASAAPWLEEAGLATDKRGFLQVNDTLQSISHPQVFAAGDVATMVNHPRPKAGVFAVRQGEPLYKNLRRVLQNKSPKPFIPQKQFLILIGTGDQKAIASHSWLGFGPHPLIWRWKDYIDRRFMEKFSNLSAEMQKKETPGKNPPPPYPS
ncbi:MAG: FAD-dependent oxidoreductase, partial [Coleofasciculaceae cyanobacterium]